MDIMTYKLHTNCGSCSECAQNPQIVRYTCEMGGSYERLNGYVSVGVDCRGEKSPPIIKHIIVGQVAGLVVFVATNNPLYGALACLGASIVYLFIDCRLIEI